MYGKRFIKQLQENKTKRVLFVGAGRRVSLGEWFQRSGYTVFSYELNKQVPISSIATIIVGLKWNDPLIEKDIINVVKKHKIDLVLPLQDAAIPICAKVKTILQNCTILTSDETVGRICFDKLLFELYMTQRFCDIYPLATLQYPKIYKPRLGYGSRGLFVVNDFYEESKVKEKISNRQYVVQQQIIGNEYSVDAYFSKEKLMIDCVPRQRLRVGDGEVISSLTEDNSSLYQTTKRVGETLGLKGPACFQYILTEDKIYIIEINARFGGGVILSFQAGFDIIRLIDCEYFGKKVSYIPNLWKKNLLMERVNREYFYET